MSMNAPQWTVSSRRQFLATTSALGVGTLAQPITTLANTGKTRIQVGFIGCGGRGTFVAKLFAENEAYELAGAADYFQDRVDAFGEAYEIDRAHRFTGLQGYKHLLEDDRIDAIAIHSPPYFHPEHVAAAVDAGKHVFLAKPIAIDVPGVRSVEASAKKAAEHGLSVCVDVQCRADEFFREATRRVREEGALGKFCYGRCAYEMGTLSPHADGDDPESRLRNWVFYKDLSGDIITEQNIHALDIFVWALGAPQSAEGRSGRAVRLEPGDTADHYSVAFDYPEGTVHFSSRQYNAWGAQTQIKNELFGSEGALFTDFGGRVFIRGSKERFYKGGKSLQVYNSGTATHIREFAQAIQSQHPDISSVSGAVETTLTTILGRMTAEQGKPVTWGELLASTARYQPTLDQLS